MSRKMPGWYGSIDGDDEGEEVTVSLELKVSPVRTILFCYTSSASLSILNCNPRHQIIQGGVPASKKTQPEIHDIDVDVSSDEDQDSSAEDARSSADVEQLVEAESDAEADINRESSDNDLMDSDDVSNHHEGSDSDSDSDGDGDDDGDAGGAIMQPSVSNSDEVGIDTGTYTDFVSF